MFDASVALMSRVGIAKTEFLATLRLLLSGSAFLIFGKQVMGNTQRAEGIHPDVNYAMDVDAYWYNGEVDPELVYDITAPARGFFNHSAIDPDNWDIDFGTTALSLESITLNESRTRVTFQFEGNANDGTITIRDESPGALGNWSPVLLVYEVYASAAIDPRVPYTLDTASTIAVDAVDPQVVVDIDSPVGGEFDPVNAIDIANWTVDAGDTTLTLASVALSGGNTVATLSFTGTAVAGTLTVQGDDVVLNGVPTSIISLLVE